MEATVLQRPAASPLLWTVDMAARTIALLRERIRSRQYVMTLHAEEELINDGLSIFDVESAILAGSIIQTQVDRQRGDRKHLIRGQTLDGSDSLTVVAKLGPTGKLVILTVYLD
jgi:hypothetical protein